jgi:aryl-alcohol dehydrogenase-like predicted oxidoreductase
MMTRALRSLEVPSVGYGAMVLSPGMYEGTDDAAAVATLRHVIDRGALIDTSDAYGHDFHNERLIGRALEGGRDGAVVSTKFGFRIPADAERHPISLSSTERPMAVNAHPKYVRQYALGSLERLGVERIDLWYPHFPDPQVPIEDTVGAMAELVDEGLVAHLGLSNVTAAQLRAAAAMHPIAAVQAEWSLWSPIDSELRTAADEVGAGIVAWWPLGAGALAAPVGNLAEGDLRSQFDRFAPEQARLDAARHETVRAVATRVGATAAQVALAWLLHQHDGVVPIPGTRRAAHVDENLAAAAITLAADDLAELDAS